MEINRRVKMDETGGMSAMDIDLPSDDRLERLDEGSAFLSSTVGAGN